MKKTMIGIQPLALEKRFFASFRSEETSMSLLSAAPHPCSAVGSKINVFLAATEWIKIILLTLVLVLLAVGCANGPPQADTPVSSPGGGLPSPSTVEPSVSGTDTPEVTVPEGIAAAQNLSLIFVEDSDGADDGINRLISSMQSSGLDFYQTADSPDGLIAPSDVVLLKINCQWAERGGTNTDLIKGVIRAILDHPDGFDGEIIVADNGQAQYGSEWQGGSLDWANANSIDRDQSAMDVIRSFQAEGYRVTGVLWDEFTTVRVSEFRDGDGTDGFVVEDTVRDTGLEISYPKFTTEHGTHVSFKEGIWDAAAGVYDSEKLKVINMPVLKSHGLFQVTGAVKGYMGTPSDKLTQTRAHNSIGFGGMGTQMAGTRMPVLNIMDMIWVGPERGPGVSYSSAVQVNKIAASTDPFALDSWAAKHILMPEAEKLPGGRAASMDPGGTEPGTFGYWMRLSMNELHKAGIWATMDEREMQVIER